MGNDQTGVSLTQVWHTVYLYINVCVHVMSCFLYVFLNKELLMQGLFVLRVGGWGLYGCEKYWNHFKWCQILEYSLSNFYISDCKSRELMQNLCPIVYSFTWVGYSKCCTVEIQLLAKNFLKWKVCEEMCSFGCCLCQIPFQTMIQNICKLGLAVFGWLICGNMSEVISDLVRCFPLVCQKQLFYFVDAGCISIHGSTALMMCDHWLMLL